MRDARDHDQPGEHRPEPLHQAQRTRVEPQDVLHELGAADHRAGQREREQRPVQRLDHAPIRSTTLPIAVRPERQRSAAA